MASDDTQQQTESGVWPPAPVSLSMEKPPVTEADLKTAAEVQRHLSAARRSLVFSLLLSPFLCLPFAFYHGYQANVKGGQGQGKTMLVIATVYATIVAILLLGALIVGRFWTL